MTAVTRHPEKIPVSPNVRAVGDSAISAARAAGRRLFGVGGAGSLNGPDGRPLAETLPEAYRPEALAMRGVLNSLKASDVGERRISAEDYADALVNELDTPAHRRSQMTIAYV